MEKKSFKIVLDSTNTNSYIGNKYDANYYIDLSTVIRKIEDYNKSYYIYCNFISSNEISATTNIISTYLYTLNLNISNKNNNIYQYNNNNLYSFILPVRVISSDNGAVGGVHNGFFLQDKDQSPLYIENIKNINNISLKVLQTGPVAAPVTTTTTATPPYVCILTFVQA